MSNDDTGIKTILILAANPKNTSKLRLGVDRRFVSLGAADGYKPYTATITEIGTRFKRDRK
jgi:hypothetical protein